MIRSKSPGKCLHCKIRLTAEESADCKTIHLECVKPWVEVRKLKEKATWEARRLKAARVDRAADRVKKEGQKRIPDLIRETQAVFNKYVRTRDQLAGYPCISSGRLLDWSGNKTDAGHFRSTGAAPHLRFNADNCHAQSKHDNLWLSGNAVAYRINLIERIGLRRVEALESNNRVEKWTREDLLDIKAEFAIRCKALKKELDNG